MANAPDTIYSMLADADLTFPDVQDAAGAAHPLTQGTYVSYLESTDRTLRKNAFTAMYQVYGGVQNTCAAVLAAQVKQLQFFAASPPLCIAAGGRAGRHPCARSASMTT